MIGTLNREHKQVTVVGAGISGLLVAYQLDKAGFEVTIVEGSDRAGGLIRTVRTELGISESAAHSVLATHAVRELARDLGVELAEVRKDSKARFILRDGKPSKLPLRFSEIIRAFFRAYFVLADTKIPAERITLAQWAERFLGKPALNYLFTPFVRGVYAADPANLAVGAIFPALLVPHGHSLLSFQLSRLVRRLFQKSKKKTDKQRKKMVAPAQGMGSLVEALEHRLRERLGSRFKTSSPIQELPPPPNIVLTIPAYRAAPLFTEVDPKLSQALRKVRYTPLVSATIFVPARAFSDPVKGVGVLMPEVEGRSCLGVLFNSSSFPNRVTHEAETASFTMMIGGSARPELFQASDTQLEKLISDELHSLFGLKAAPSKILIHRWERAIPQYNLDLMDAWAAAREGWCATPGRILFGNYATQVSLRGMIESAESLAAGLQHSG